MPAVDARLTNKNYPVPETFANYSVFDLLTSAAYGRIGVDQRLVQSILDRGDAAVDEVASFADEPFEQENTANLTRWLFLLLRHYKTPRALPFLISLVKANLDELPEELMEAVLEIGSPAVDPIIALYDELDDDDLLGEVAFLLASFRNRDPRILKRLLDYFEYDAVDGAIILNSFGDPAAIPAIEKILAEPGLEEVMKGELESIVEQLREESTTADDVPPPYDVMAEFDAIAEPNYDVLADYELMELLSSPSDEYRTGAVDNLTSQDLTPGIVKRLQELARADPNPRLRGRAWEALAGDPDDKPLIAEMTALLEDASKPVEERVGTLVALASLDKYARIKETILEFYHAFPQHRARIIKAMWRTLDKAWAKYIVEAVQSADPEVREQGILGIGNLSLSSEVDKLEALFLDDEARPAALFAYAMAAPGETTRARMKSLFTLIEKLADGLDEAEAHLVEGALDERLAIRGLKPVFVVEPEPEPPPTDALPKVGRNDPCPCGSGQKYKKCHGK